MSQTHGAPDGAAPVDGAAGEALQEQLLAATVGALELYGVHLGRRLGLYAALGDGAARTAPELAAAAGIAPRYAREWLEQQAVAGMLSVDDASAPADERRYALPPAHRGVLLDPEAPEHLAPLAGLVVGIAGALDDVVLAYRSGDGVPFSRYGPHLREGQGGINRPAFSSALVEEWVPALPGLTDRLVAGARVADVGCGQGWASLAVARTFPAAEVWGIDADPASIDDARRAAAAVEREEPGATEGLHYVQDEAAAALGRHAPFDLVMVLEVLHDLARPVELLAAARAALAGGGVVLVADEAVAPAFTAPGDQIERMMYGWSITHCLPASLAEGPSAATGTVLREDGVRAMAAAAGFGAVDVLDVDGGFFRLYALTP